MGMNRVAVWGFWLALSAPLVAMAKPEIQLEIKAEKEIVVMADGKEVKKRVAAETVEPGEVVIYTLSYRNVGDEAAHNVVLDNPIPEGTSYIVDSAYGEGAQITFSIDMGKSYKQSSLLTYQMSMSDGSKEEMQATPDKYTNIRWVLKEVAAGGRGEVGFRAKVQ